MWLDDWGLESFFPCHSDFRFICTHSSGSHVQHSHAFESSIQMSALLKIWGLNFFHLTIFVSMCSSLPSKFFVFDCSPLPFPCIYLEAAFLNSETLKRQSTNISGKEWDHFALPTSPRKNLRGSKSNCVLARALGQVSDQCTTSAPSLDASVH